MKIGEYLIKAIQETGTHGAGEGYTVSEEEELSLASGRGLLSSVLIGFDFTFSNMLLHPYPFQLLPCGKLLQENR